MRRLENKVAIVAGGGGIGGATARRLAEEGCKVILGDIALEPAEQVARSIVAAGGDCIAVAYDQAEDASVGALIESAIRRHGCIDCLHANAADLGAMRVDGDALSIELEVFDRTMDVNMRGFLLLTRHVMPHLLRNGGAIVYTSSGAAHVGEPMRIAYAMSKAAILALVRHVASRWGKEGVRANAICPGLVLSDFVKSYITEDRISSMLVAHRSPRLGTPEDIAAMVAMLFSKDGEWINGQTLSVDGGITMRA